jgi:LPS-assembly protein
VGPFLMRRLSAAPLLLAGALLADPFPAAAQAPGAMTVHTDGDVTILADRLEQVSPDNLLVATGNVELTRGTTRLLADRLEMDRETGDVVAQGRVIFYDGDDQLTGERVEYNVKTGTGVVYRGRIRVAPSYRIAGERLERVGVSVYRVRRGIFTTCDDDESPAWSFRFGEATADLEDLIYGTNASFWAKNVPLIPFFPFFAAAIRRERQTGFLPPVFGTSARRGFFIEIPFFWAISDSQDATLGLDYFERRGVGGSAEYRYILSEKARGSVGGLWVHESMQNDDDRGWGRLRHDWQIAPGLQFRADVNGVSDDGVLRLYEDSLQQRAAQRAESNVSLTRTLQNWNLVGRVFAYQDLTTPHPVELQRLPEVSIQAVRQPLPGRSDVLYQVDAGVVHFYRELGSDGTRADLRPRLSRPIPLAGYATVTPFAGGRVTAYDRTVTSTGFSHDIFIEHTDERERVRRLAEFGSDLETRAARVYALGGAAGLDALLHSIEPRVRYIRVLGENLYSLPIWDERIDHVPEADWLEYSITNRLRGRTVGGEGTEAVRQDLARFTVAHAYDIGGARWGNLAGDLLVQPTKMLRFRGDVSYNVEHGIFQAGTTDVEVTLPFVTAKVGTRFDRRESFVPDWVETPGTYNPGPAIPEKSNVNFLQGAIASEVTKNLALRASTNYDARTSTFVETRFGADLKFQCWALLIEYINRSPEFAGKIADNEFRFSLNLLGVGGVLTTRVGAGDSGPHLK